MEIEVAVAVAVAVADTVVEKERREAEEVVGEGGGEEMWLPKNRGEIIFFPSSFVCFRLYLPVAVSRFDQWQYSVTSTVVI